MTLAVDWTKHISNEDAKEDFAKVVYNSTVVLMRLRDMLTEYEKELARIEVKSDSYENSAWCFKQAHINGRKQELKRLKDLLSFLNKE